MNPCSPRDIDFIVSRAKEPTARLFGHMDADGFLATEQTRRNLEAAGISIVSQVISPSTASYRFWRRAFRVEQYDSGLAIFIDIALDFHDPYDSIESISTVSVRNPDTMFVVIDHHAMPNLQWLPKNLLLISTPTVFDCCLGSPSDEFMVPASICDGERSLVRERVTDAHERRAEGVRRAVADAKGVANHVSDFLTQRRWSFFETLASEPPECHRNVRGRRSPRSRPSPAIDAAMGVST